METAALLYNFIIATFGIVFNSLILLVIAKRVEKDVTSFFINMMSLADTLYLVSAPFAFFIVSTEHISVSCFIYQLQTVLTHFSAAEASWILVIMSVERFVSIAFVVFKSPQLHQKTFRLGTIITTVAIFVLYTVVLYTYGFKRNHYENCGRTTKEFSHFDIIVQFVLPLTAITISVAYVIMSFRRLNHPQTHAQILSSQSIVFICLSAVFALFSSPLYVFELWMLQDWTEYSRRFHVLVVSVYNTQAAMKLFVYSAFEEEFRRDFRKMLSGWWAAFSRTAYSRFSVDGRTDSVGSGTEETEDV